MKSDFVLIKLNYMLVAFISHQYPRQEGQRQIVFRDIIEGKMLIFLFIIRLLI